MTVDEEDGGPGAVRPTPASVKSPPWHKRPTLRQLRKAAAVTPTWAGEHDAQQNDETRLPESEEIALGAVVLTEAFTPSKVSYLYRALAGWPAVTEDERRTRLEELARSRSGESTGWQSLDVVRHPGAPVLTGHTDPNLPLGVDGVWLSVSYITASLAMVVATFVFTAEAGDLSPLLRANYRTEWVASPIVFDGPLAGLRARIPWSRPRPPQGLRASHSINMPESRKQSAVETLIDDYQLACSEWLAHRFPGRFASARYERRPALRMLFTKEQVPYADRPPWLRPVGLDFAMPLWSSTDPVGWWMRGEPSPFLSHRRVLTLAARRSDIAQPQGGDDGESNWALAQIGLGYGNATLAARYALSALLALYGDRLRELRDTAGTERRISRPVQAARALDDYLIRDGLDAATITTELEEFTSDLRRFRLGVPELVEHLDHIRAGVPADYEPVEYVPALRDEIHTQAARLKGSTTAATENIRASAELRQAISNTTLQRLTLALAVVAVLIAIASLATGSH